MAFTPAPNIVQVEIVASKDLQIIENRFHVNVFHEPTPADLAAINAQVTTSVNLSYAPLMPVEVVFTKIKQTSLHTQNGITREDVLNTPGTVVGGALPNEVTYCVSLKTGVRGRSARGRFYVMGVAKSQQLGQNQIGAGFRTNIVAMVQQLRNNIAGLGYAWTIVSYITNGAPRVGGPVYFEVLTATTFDDILDSQRRRRPGIGT